MSGTSRRDDIRPGTDRIEPGRSSLPGHGGTRTVPAFAPGMRELLAAQLAAGFGGADAGGLLGGGQATPQAMRGYLDRIHAPVTHAAYSGPSQIPEAGGGEPEPSPRAAPRNPRIGQRRVHYGRDRTTLMEWDGHSWRSIAER